MIRGLIVQGYTVVGLNEDVGLDLVGWDVAGNVADRSIMQKVEFEDDNEDYQAAELMCLGDSKSSCWEASIPAFELCNFVDDTVEGQSGQVLEVPSGESANGGRTQGLRLEFVVVSTTSWTASLGNDRSAESHL